MMTWYPNSLSTGTPMTPRSWLTTASRNGFDVAAGGGATEVAALGAAPRVGRALGGDGGEVGAGAELGDDRVGLRRGRHEDVAGAHLGEVGRVLLEVGLEGGLVEAALPVEVALEDQHPGVPGHELSRGRPRGSSSNTVWPSPVSEKPARPRTTSSRAAARHSSSISRPRRATSLVDDRVLDLAGEDIGGERRREVALAFAEHVDAPALEASR